MSSVCVPRMHGTAAGTHTMVVLVTIACVLRTYNTGPPPGRSQFFVPVTITYCTSLERTEEAVITYVPWTYVSSALVPRTHGTAAGTYAMVVPVTIAYVLRTYGTATGSLAMIVLVTIAYVKTTRSNDNGVKTTLSKQRGQNDAVKTRKGAFKTAWRKPLYWGQR